ncbi:hypothetical protein KI387_022434 [Taxus chinensis]|uniref:Chromo domain-containing protein n=1 Tax=Taxus chinensis TaxID=29808 RepID=A0AA38LAR4_TAXCH|nr:hypothetical protein KI387_022434 [Taxus chinensis]
MTPFRALYGYDARSFVDMAFGDSRASKARECLQDSQDILKTLKDNMQQAQNQQKVYVDRHMSERSFEVGDMVFLRLQPYRQSTLKKSGAEKLNPRFYGQYRMVRRVGQVAYELELPSESKIHNVFHVSCLKKALGQHVTSSVELPPLDDEGRLDLVPEELLDWRERRLWNKVIREYLVRWKDLPLEDATWEGIPRTKTLVDSSLVDENPKGLRGFHSEISSVVNQISGSFQQCRWKGLKVFLVFFDQQLGRSIVDSLAAIPETARRLPQTPFSWWALLLHKALLVLRPSGLAVVEKYNGMAWALWQLGDDVHVNEGEFAVDPEDVRLLTVGLVPTCDLKLVRVRRASVKRNDVGGFQFLVLHEPTPTFCQHVALVAVPASVKMENAFDINYINFISYTKAAMSQSTLIDGVVIIFSSPHLISVAFVFENMECSSTLVDKDGTKNEDAALGHGLACHVVDYSSTSCSMTEIITVWKAFCTTEYAKRSAANAIFEVSLINPPANFFVEKFTFSYTCILLPLDMVLLELSRSRNKLPLPRSISGPGIALPPEQDTLIGPNYQLEIPRRPIPQALEEMEVDEEDGNKGDPVNPQSFQEHKTDQENASQRVSFSLSGKRPR